MTMYDVYIDQTHALYVDGKRVDILYIDDEDDDVVLRAMNYYQCTELKFLYPSQRWFRDNKFRFPYNLEDVDLS